MHSLRSLVGSAPLDFSLSCESCGVSIIVSHDFHFRIRQDFVFFRIIGVNISSTLGIEPDIHGAVIDDVDFIKHEIGMALQVFLDNFLEVALVDLEFPFNETFLAVVLDGIDTVWSCAPLLLISAPPYWKGADKCPLTTL